LLHDIFVVIFQVYARYMTSIHLVVGGVEVTGGHGLMPPEPPAIT
jgi:hypothetical protein